LLLSLRDDCNCREHWKATCHHWSLSHPSAVNAVTTDEIKRVAQKYLWDKDVRVSSQLKLGTSTQSLPFRSLLQLSAH
jgi:hypothetical protein